MSAEGTTGGAEAPGGRGGRALAWGVHAFTASGAVVGLAALLAIAAGNPGRAALLMLVALVIDSVDGTLARKARVGERAPKLDGRRLDDIVDYLNYVIVPAFFMVWADPALLLHWGVAAAPVLASAYQFSQTDAKTDDDFFLGFPSYWNVLAIYLWGFALSPLAGTLWVLLFSALVFVPIKYIYPSKMRTLRGPTAALAGGWLALVTLHCAAPELLGGWPLRLSLAFPAYYFALSLWVGGIPERHGR